MNRPIPFSHRLRHAGPRTALSLLGLASAAALAAAFIAQYGFGLKPCHLCLLQRYPYAAVIALALAAQIPRTPARAMLLAAGLALAAGAGIAAYHTGVEYGVFPGPSSCTASAAAPDLLEALREQIRNAPLVSCDAPAIKILGLSLAGWNMLLYAFLTILAFYSWYKTKKSRIIN